MKTLVRSLLISLLAFSAIGMTSAQFVNFDYDYNYECAPMQVIFTNLSDTAGINGAPEWDWYIEGHPYYDTQNPPPITFDGGEWEVTLTLYDDDGWVDEYTIYMYAYGDLTSFLPPDQFAICPDEPVNFHFSDEVSWSDVLWNFGDGSVNIRDDNYVDHTFFNEGTYDVYLWVDHFCGPDSVTQQVQVGGAAIPLVEAYAQGGGVICPNEEVFFNSSYDHTSYLWNFGDGMTSTEQNPHHFYETQVPQDYTVILEATNNCGNKGYDTITVSVVDFTEANAWFYMETNQWENYACPNTPVKFIPESPANMYQWDFGDGTFSNEREPVNYYTEERWYYVTLTVINGCGNEDSHTDSIEIDRFYEDAPYVDFSVEVVGMRWEELQGDTIHVCPGELVNFINNSYSFDESELVYEWDLGLGDDDPPKSKDISHAYLNPGIYRVWLTATAPCGGDDSYSKWIWVDAGLAPNVSLSAIPDMICSGETVYFWDEDDENYGRYVYDIIFGDGTDTTGITTPMDPMMHTLAQHSYSGTPGQEFDFNFTATNQCGVSAGTSGTITITNDPLDKPFYYVENSTTMEENQPMNDWSIRRDDSDHEFLIHAQWSSWPGGSDKFAVFFWYGEFDPMSVDDLPPAAGYVEFTSSTIFSGATVQAFVPMDPLNPASIGLAVVWSCDGLYYQGVEPDVWGSQLNFLGAPILSFPINPGGNTDLGSLGNPIILDGSGDWDGICDNLKPDAEYYYELNADNYIHLSLDEDAGMYYLDAYADPEGITWLASISWGDYAADVGDMAFFTDWDVCGQLGEYTYSLGADQITFSPLVDPCPDRLQYLTMQPFMKKPDFGGNRDDKSVCPDDLVLFKVAGGSSYVWHFGDGESSTEQYPLHSYTDAGIYEAFVIGTNACGRSDTMYTRVKVTDTNVPDATFWYEGWDFPRLENIQFIWGYPDEDPVGNLLFNWDFGDGNTSSEMNPVHAYEEDGEYMIQLTVTNGCGPNTYSEYIYIRDAIKHCEAKFTTDSIVGQAVYFRDISRGNVTSWFWDFGDGSTSTEQNPQYNYARDGIYYACLSIYDEIDDCFSQVCHEVHIGTQDCLAQFVYSSNDANNTVVFADQSTNADEWFWDFGNGYFSSAQNPEWQYDEPGLFMVCLSIYDADSDCFSEICKEVQVGVSNEDFCFAEFSYFVNEDNSVNFTDQSSNNITNWYWTFGDGSYIDQRHPVKHYQVPGLYEACLVVFDEETNCVAEICKRIPVGVAGCNQNAAFSFFVDFSNDAVAFSNKSTGQITDYFWDFGDGTTSTMESPSHKYEEQGFYLVTLSVWDNGTDCADHTAEFMLVGDPPDCRAAFEYTVDGSTNNVQFFNKSQGDIVEYFWYFDDGNYSEFENPSHYFERPGLYFVSLTVLSNDGLCMDYFFEPVQVGSVSCAADFKYFVDSASNVGYFSPDAIGQVTDYLWFFGDGDISTEIEPEHKFAQPGYYLVGLNTFDAGSDCMDYYEEVILIGQSGVDCRANYIYRSDPDNMLITFNDNSKGDIVEWIWDFGDGLYDFVQNPEHTYLEGGYYMVCLTVVNSDGIPNTFCDFVPLATGESDDCFANYFYTVDSESKTVSFVDQSFGSPDEWYWNFDDGSTSTQQNPEHTFGDADFYLVQLSITNSSTGCISEHYELINVDKGNLGLQADFAYEAELVDLKAESYPVDFVGVSLGDAGKLKWSFGDHPDEGTDTTTLTPHYEYDNPGTYWVCLTISNPNTGDESMDCDSVSTDQATALDPNRAWNSGLGNFPNPFETTTYIRYELSEASDVNLAVFDNTGRMVDILVRNELRIAGPHRMEYNASGLSSGVYTLRLVNNRGVYTSKMIVR